MKAEEKKQVFEKVYQDFKDPIYRTCCIYLSSEADRQDLFQEILTKVWNALEGLRSMGALKTWIYRISNNTALQHVISQKKKEHNQVDHELIPLIDSHEHDLDKKIRQEKTIEDLYQQINKLPAFDRSLISMILEELSMREIAEITGLHEGNVRVKVHRVKKKLKVMLEENNGY